MFAPANENANSFRKGREIIAILQVFYKNFSQKENLTVIVNKQQYNIIVVIAKCNGVYP